MNKTLKKVFMGVVGPALATLFVAASGWSMSHGDGPADPQRKVAHMAQMLQLTEEQTATVQTLVTTSFEASAADRQRLHSLKAQLLDQPASFDAGPAQATADEIGQITSRMVFRMASTRAQIYQLLNDEQKEKMDEMSLRAGKRGDKRPGPDGPMF
tara:strand:+ start:7647 stop:8114 length:468 start_codon:yes stop_codon:yes gene_type:complete